MLAIYLVLWLLVAVAAAVAVFSLYMCYHYRRFQHIPSPKRPSFFLGHIPDINRLKQPMSEIYNKWYQDAGPVFVVFFVFRTIVVTLNPEDGKNIFANPSIGKSEEIFAHCKSVCGERFLGNGLLSVTDNNVWKPRRKIYDAGFHRSQTKLQTPMINECVTKVVDQLKPLADGKSFVGMKDFLHTITADVISKVAFSSDFSHVWDEKSLGLKSVRYNGHIHHLVAKILEGVQRTLRNPVAFELLHPFEAESYREATRAIRKIGKKCIETRISALKNGEKCERDILSCILNHASVTENFDLEDIIDDFATFYSAGQETTANMLCFTFILIHQHPEVLKILRDEIDRVFKDSVDITDEQVKNLHYMEQVFEETLRMYPPISGLVKTSPKGGVDVSGYHVPQGTLITIVAAVLCRSTHYFDDPNRFDPERFNPENARPSGYVYFPFGIGQRKCIARHFAMMEAKIALGRLLQQFEFIFPENYKLVPITNAVLRPDGIIPCKISLRTLH